jgi:large subunit ribosomal protein L23
MSVGQARAGLAGQATINLGQAQRLENNQYTFSVHPQVSGREIKLAIEDLFDVKVVAVSTSAPLRKDLRVGRVKGYRPRYKQAVVTLAPGDDISLPSERLARDLQLHQKKRGRSRR